jgi:hypothetical protein
MPKKKPPVSVKPDGEEITAESLAFLHLFALGCGKIGYKHADAAIELLLKKQRHGTITIAEIDPHINPLLQEFAKFAGSLAGKKFKIVDGWRAKLKVNTGSNVRRYELEEITSV